MALESIGFLLGAEASSVPRGRALALLLLPIDFTAVLATARPRLGGTWACEVFQTSFRQVWETQSPVTDPKQHFQRGLCLQPSLPFMLVTHTIDAGANITSHPSEPGLAVWHQFLFGSWDLPTPGSLWDTLGVCVPSTCTPGFRGACFLGISL